MTTHDLTTSTAVTQDLSCSAYQVCVHVKGHDREAVLASPAGVAFLAALAAARAARAAQKEANDRFGEAESTLRSAYHEKERSSPEGEELARASRASTLADGLISSLTDALEAAERREALDRLLGRYPVFSAHKARTILRQAKQTCRESRVAVNTAAGGVLALCVAEQKARDLAHVAYLEAVLATEDAEEALDEAHEPLQVLIGIGLCVDDS